MKYTYSDEEDEGYSDATTSRRSTRNTGTHTPAEGLAPTVTLSGRQVKARQGGAYGESILSGTHTPALTTGGYDETSEEPEHAEGAGGRPRRAAAANVGTKGWGSKGGAHIEGYNSVDEMNDSDEDDASEQDYGDDEEEDDHVSLESDKDEDELSDEDDEMDDDQDEKKSLVVKLPVKTPTPERKTIIKVRLSPENDSVKPVDFQQTVTGDQDKAHSATPAQSGTGSSAAATATDAASSKDNANPSGLTSAPTHVTPVSSEAATNPISVHPKSPSNPVPTASPLSPNLAFRGSPEKSQNVFPPPSINVGYGGS
jgi:hypothetical protein